MNMLGCKNCRHWSPKNEKCRKGRVLSREEAVCIAFEVYPAKRDLDGCYFRVQRDGKWGNVCFSDMTPEEREEVLGDRRPEWWKSLACHVADCLRQVGDTFEIVSNMNEE